MQLPKWRKRQKLRICPTEGVSKDCKGKAGWCCLHNVHRTQSKAIAQKPQMQTHSAEGGLQRQGKARCCCMCIANCTASTVCMMQWAMCKLHSKQYIQMHHSACVQYSECSQIARRSMHCGQCRVEAMQNTVNKRLLFPAFGFSSPPCFGFPQKVQSPSWLTNSWWEPWKLGWVQAKGL